MRKYIKVIVHYAPISERYWSEGIEASIDAFTNRIRIGGCWFNFDDRFIVEPQS